MPSCNINPIRSGGIPRELLLCPGGTYHYAHLAFVLTLAIPDVAACQSTPFHPAIMMALKIRCEIYLLSYLLWCSHISMWHFLLLASIPDIWILLRVLWVCCNKTVGTVAKGGLGVGDRPWSICGLFSWLHHHMMPLSPVKTIKVYVTFLSHQGFPHSIFLQSNLDTFIAVTCMAHWTVNTLLVYMLNEPVISSSLLPSSSETGQCCPQFMDATGLF